MRWPARRRSPHSIHAATMVTAGVYLVVRSAPLFELSGVALTVVLVVGLVTALFAATCAMAQDDIKRVLAYSTISQLGFMFVAAGMRFYTGAMFMLVAHAFYKALMFLGAGSVMHGMHEETDLQRMGGLLRRMPITGWTFVIGALSLAGIWPLAGFFAKDQILEIANHTGRTWIYLLGTLGALLSALYIGRLALPRVPRNAEERRGRTRARVARRHDRAARDPGGWGRGVRSPPFELGGGHPGEGPRTGDRAGPARRGALDPGAVGDRDRDRARRARGRVVGVRLRPDRVAHAARAAPAAAARGRERLVRRPCRTRPCS